MFAATSQAPPFDRSLKNGFRCLLYSDLDKIPMPAFEMTKLDKFDDFYSKKPVDDAIYRIYKDQFDYDKTNLNTSIDFIDSSATDWIYERLSIDASYGQERIILNLFIPKNISPPYQTVIYFPGVGSLAQQSSEDITNYFEFKTFLSFLVRDGRAVLYPVYQGTFERSNSLRLRYDSHQYTDFITQVVQDYKRSLDYLETRDDIDTDKLAYYGMSWGAMMGPIINSVDDRAVTNIYLAGGLGSGGRSEVNSLNYITHVKKPTIMINGKYDMSLPYETSIKPMFDLLGTPDKHKKLSLYESDHLVPKNDFIKESLSWLDLYLGPVK
jgi:hypothetical protein